MGTVDKTWVFTADNQGLADVGDSAITVAHDAAGNPGGSLEFVGAASGVTERARKATTGETWETWGVPAGAIVTSLQVISWDKQRYDGNAATCTVTMRVLDSGAVTVHSAGDLVNAALGTGVDGAWVGQGAGTSRLVDGGSQPSTTDVRLEVQVTLSIATSGFDLGIDNVLLRITYTGGGVAPPDGVYRYSRMRSPRFG
jgi:hypothetical protein